MGVLIVCDNQDLVEVLVGDVLQVLFDRVGDVVMEAFAGRGTAHIDHEDQCGRGCDFESVPALSVSYVSPTDT